MYLKIYCCLALPVVVGPVARKAMVKIGLRPETLVCWVRVGVHDAAIPAATAVVINDPG